MSLSDATSRDITRHHATSRDITRHHATLVAWLVGSVLLLTAGLKLVGLFGTALPAVGWWSSPGLQSLAVAAELGMGFWLISGYTQALAFWAARLLFLMFGMISSYLGAQGVAHCGCFGEITASPWTALSIDIVALLLLSTAWPKPENSWRSETIKLVPAALTLVVLTAVSFSASYVFCGSMEGAIARLKGQTMTTPGYLDMGEGPPSAVLEGYLPITNHSSHKVTFFGGTFDCSCLTSESMPLTIGPYSIAHLKVKLRVPEGRGQLTRSAELWTDCDAQPILRIQIGANIRNDSE